VPSDRKEARSYFTSKITKYTSPQKFHQLFTIYLTSNNFQPHLKNIKKHQKTSKFPNLSFGFTSFHHGTAGSHRFGSPRATADPGSIPQPGEPPAVGQHATAPHRAHRAEETPQLGAGGAGAALLDRMDRTRKNIR
jgi:hypothetical protein